MRHSFHVDLQGVVDLLSHHLYTSPRVYLRELLQNSVDAITARGLDPADGRISVEPPEATGDGTLRIHDNGIGLTESEVHELLATIGRSAKRDDLGFARHEFLGQFGIGLLSCFMVADEIEVVTRGPGPAATVIWRGHGDGHYTVAPGPERPEQGTTVTLRPRPGSEHWLTAPAVAELARGYGGLLPYDIRVDGTRITDGPPPWTAAYPDPQLRRDALLRYAERVLGFRPFDVIDLAVPEAGLTGVAFVLPAEAHPGERAAHRVYLKRMLISDRVEGLLPDWAFFARCVVDTTELRPTAAREQLYEDELLAAARHTLGDRLRDWLMRLAAAEPERMRDFLRIHDRGVRALALHDDDMLRLVYRWLDVETADGAMTLAEYRRRHGPRISYTPTVEEFRQLAGVASAQGIGLVNAGYEYGVDILRRLPAIDPDLRAERLETAELAARFEPADPGVETDAFLAAAVPVLDRFGCEPVLRSFDPPAVPVLYLDSAASRTYADHQTARQEATGAWADALGAGAGPAPAAPMLVFNHRSPLVRKLLTTTDRSLLALAVEALYGHALLTGWHPLRPADAASLNRSFLGLLERAMH